MLNYKYLLALTPEQESRATEISDVCRFVWNLALEQRREYRRRGAWMNFYDQTNELTELRAAEPWIASVPRKAVEQTLRDLDRACKRHGTWRVNWKSRRDHRRSFLCRDRKYIRVERINHRWGRVRVEGMGWMKFRMTRDLDGEVRTVTVTRDAGRWHVCILVDDGLVGTKPKGPAVGIDRGVAVAIATSDGDFLNRDFATDGERIRIKRLQQQLSRQQKGSNRRAATRAKLQRTLTRTPPNPANQAGKHGKSGSDQHTSKPARKWSQVCRRYGRMSAQSNGIGTPGRNELCVEHSMLLCRLCNRVEKPKFGTVRKPLKKSTTTSRYIRQADYLSAIGKAKARQGGVCVGLLAGIDHDCTEMEWLHGVDQRTIAAKLGPDTPALTDDRIGAYGCRYINGSLDEWRGPLRDVDTRLHLKTFWHPQFELAVIEYGLEVEAERKWEGA